MNKKDQFERLTRFNANTFAGGNGLIKYDEAHIGSMVYFLYMRLGGKVLLIYVGQTTRGCMRIEEHMLYKNFPIDVWFYIPVNPHLLDDVERFYIREFEPYLNMVDNPAFIKSDGHYTKSKEELHDVQRRRIERLRMFKLGEQSNDPEILKLFRFDEAVTEDGSFPILRLFV